VSERKLRLGIAGLGKAFSLMIPTFSSHPLLAVVAGADPRAGARKKFAQDFSAKAYTTVEELCNDASVEVVYVSTPHQCHVEHVRAAAAQGKHVLVEKPMALTIGECRSMIDAARRADVHLIVGHSHSFDRPIQRAREIIASGEVGPLRMITAVNFTDFLYRPRRPEELITEKGGGVIYNQAPHHVDIVRFLGGGKVRSVRATAGAWDSQRPTEGAYSALLTFESGVSASLTYSGYAHFDTDEFCGWVAESGLAKDPKRYGATRRNLSRASGANSELDIKNAQTYGGAEYAGSSGAPATAEPRSHQQFGLVIASCERADLRPMPQGVMIYDDHSSRLDALPPPAVPKNEVIAELYDAVVKGAPPVHNGEWGLATMEVCFAMLRSAREQKEIFLEHQISLPNRN